MKRRRGGKAGDPESRPRYVALYHSEMDSMAFKTLSPAAVWLLAQMRRAWRGNSDRIPLAFKAVSWKLTFYAFDKARRELVEAGFVRIVNPGGLNEGPRKNAAVYAPFHEGWRGEVAKRLANDPKAGYMKEIRTKDGPKSVWYPARPRSGRQESADRARMIKMTKVKTTKKTAPAKPKKIYQTSKLYLNRVRVAKLLEGGGALGKTRELRNRN